MPQGVRPNAHGLLFHPDLIKGTSLGQDIKHYSFFSYASAEALHLSEEEKSIFTDCLEKIRMELQHPIDKHSKRLISRNIELLLDYCMRFYERQFITRSESNKMRTGKIQKPCSTIISKATTANGRTAFRKILRRQNVFLSPNYFGDLIKKETGKTRTGIHPDQND